MTRFVKPIPVLDKTKSYPSKKIGFDTDTTYVPLETSNKVLLGGTCYLSYVSDRRILLTDRNSGDVFLFDQNGKIYSSFNRKGGLGYLLISFVAYDEKNAELFILDHIRQKVFVYSENGTLLRSFDTPAKSHIQEIYNFDDTTLLVFDENQYGSSKIIKPYIYIAKNDGKVLGYVNASVEKVNPAMYSESTGKNHERTFIFTHYGTPDNCKFGNDFILSNKSMDTIYMLKQDKTLIPLFSQVPSVFSEHPTAASVGMVTDQYLEICVSSYDVNEGVKLMKAGKKWKPGFHYYILDLKSGKFYDDPEEGDFSVHKVDTSKGQDYKLMQAVNLVKKNQQGLLSGELKKLTSKLDIGDNPVIRIVRFK